MTSKFFTVLCNNKSTIGIAHDLVCHDWTKHVDCGETEKSIVYLERGGGHLLLYRKREALQNKTINVGLIPHWYIGRWIRPNRLSKLISSHMDIYPF